MTWDYDDELPVPDEFPTGCCAVVLGVVATVVAVVVGFGCWLVDRYRP